MTGTPRQAVGRRKIGPGIYVDKGSEIHVMAPELLEHLGIPDTPETEDGVAEACKQIAAQLSLDFQDVDYDGTA